MIKRGVPEEEKKKQNRNIDFKITLFADYITVYQKPTANSLLEIQSLSVSNPT